MNDGEATVAAEDIAIIGMSGRFPQAADLTEFWENLRSGRCSISEFTDEELLESGVPEEFLADPNYVKAWGWMDGVDRFDAGFFDITPREAEITDPQIRLLLECAWETLEDAGYDPDRYPGRIGVYAGSSMMSYLWQNLVPTPGLIDSVGYVAAWIVNDRDFVATRINYKLNLRGPGMTVQTACSTSLVCQHLAIQSLLTGESDMVLAGGVCAPFPYKEGYFFGEGGTLSPDGKVRTFDAEAKGMLGGNGVALVLLKRLEDALRDGDHIRAVVKGTALNNDGVDKVTYTAPSVEGQVQVILDTLDVAGVAPGDISYVEAHGTGTPLGDPIEIAALTQAWRAAQEEAGADTRETGWCPIGSVKTNIGHLDTAAGVAGMIKAVLALEQREIPPSLNFESPNPQIDFDASPFVVNTELCPWETERLPRRAAVSSLGMGGTNAHAILEEAPARPPTESSRSHQLFLLSARSEAALEAAGSRMAKHLAGRGADQSLADAAFTTQVGRKAFLHRLAVVARDHAGAVDALETLDRARTEVGSSMLTDRPVAFLFSGQGAQYADMARGIYGSEALFREEVDRCCALLEPHLGHDLRTLLFPSAGDEEKADEALQRTENTQPALFVVEYALARLLASFGVEPAAMLGHSIGEYVAACLAGVFSLEDGLRLVAARGRLIGALPQGGGMLAVELAESSVTPFLQNGLCLAAVNAPELCVVSGPLEEIERLERGLAGRNVSTRRLHTSHAFHSEAMEPILAEFEREVALVTLSAPERAVISCTTGEPLGAAEAVDPAYWVRHLREPVRFADGVSALLAEDRVLLEVGPGQTLTSLARLSLLERPDVSVIPTTRHPKDAGAEDFATLLRALGALWIAGASIDWDGFHASEERRRVPLPTYPFERQRFWVERPRAGALLAAAAPAPTKNPDLSRWFYVPSWRQAPRPAAPARLGEGADWLLFADRGGLADSLATELRGAGARVATVRAGASFERIGEDEFTLDPRAGDDVGRVLTALSWGLRRRTPTRSAIRVRRSRRGPSDCCAPPATSWQ